MIGIKLSGQAHELGFCFSRTKRTSGVECSNRLLLGFILLAIVLTGICRWGVGLACGAAIFSHQCRRVLHLGLNLELKDQTMQAATSLALPLPFLAYLLFQLRSVNREWSRLARAFRAGVIARKRIETTTWTRFVIWIMFGLISVIKDSSVNRYPMPSHRVQKCKRTLLVRNPNGRQAVAEAQSRNCLFNPGFFGDLTDWCIRGSILMIVIIIIIIKGLKNTKKPTMVRTFDTETGQTLTKIQRYNLGSEPIVASLLAAWNGRTHLGLLQKSFRAPLRKLLH